MFQSRSRSVLLAALLALATADAGWARCGVSHQLASLEASPSKCTPEQLLSLRTVLSNRLQFRESLDLPLARKVLEERQCPSEEELGAFLDAWKQLPGTGVVYTVKRYCLTTPTYLIRFPAPGRPLDDVAATKLADDIDRLQNVVIPALASKNSAVDVLLR